jgi:hypothetical protein
MGGIGGIGAMGAMANGTWCMGDGSLQSSYYGWLISFQFFCQGNSLLILATKQVFYLRMNNELTAREARQVYQ